MVVCVHYLFVAVVFPFGCFGSFSGLLRHCVLRFSSIGQTNTLRLHSAQFRRADKTTKRQLFFSSAIHYFLQLPVLAVEVWVSEYASMFLT